MEPLRAASLLQGLARSQNRDGGWSYRAGTSRTEPTAYAVLALQTTADASSAARRGVDWLLRSQRNDGGWGPQSGVDRSTWVTSLATVALAGQPIERVVLTRAAGWLEWQVGQPAAGLDTLRDWLFGRSAVRAEPSGWSWFPGTASWVTPTMMAILALSKVGLNTAERRRRVEQAQRFLLIRQCSDGGWNHGGTFIHSEAALSYPETTGMALVGLQGVPEHSLTRSLALAKSSLPRAGSAEAASWIQIALQAHGEYTVPDAYSYPCRTNVDAALCVLAEAARQNRNAFSLRPS